MLTLTIKEALRSLGWSESKLSRESGISQPAVNQFLAGKRGMSKALLHRVMDAVGSGFAARTAEIRAELAIKEELVSRLIALTPKCNCKCHDEA